MGCGISAAVSGLDWYIVSLEQQGVDKREVDANPGFQLKKGNAEVELLEKYDTSDVTKKSGGSLEYLKFNRLNSNHISKLCMHVI